MEHEQEKILRATHIEVDLNALVANFEALKHHVAPAKVMCVVKANAYGHGLVECAKRLAKADAAYFGVALLQEGIELRQAGIKIPIHVFSGVLDDEIEHFVTYNLDLTASSVDKMSTIANVASKLKKKARVHLKVDTGLGRIGMRIERIEQLYQKAIDAEYCTVAGVFSHFARAEDEDPQFTHLQLEHFTRSLHYFEKKRYPMPIRHIANSAAVLRFRECHLDMIRPGIALYGIYPAEHLKRIALNLIPALNLKSRIVYFKVARGGSGISYKHTWIAPENTRVVTIPLGYGDGYLRCLSNRANVLIRGKRYPIVGNICMDQFMVDIGQDEAFNGDEVVLIGKQGDEQVTVNDLASLAQTVPAEILTSLNSRIPRVYDVKGNMNAELSRSIA